MDEGIVNKKILMVDDDPNLLASCKRQLRNDYIIESAVDGEEALKKIGENGGYAVIISDFQMPKMNGVEFLSKTREIAPDTVRMLLTGHADMETATGAINQGNIFRFLVKPCSMDDLKQAINAGLRQYQLVAGEKELLKQHYNKKIMQALQETIQGIAMTVEARDPYTAGHQRRVTKIASAIAHEMKLPEEQIAGLELAGLIHDIGKVYVPAEILNRPGRLTEEEFALIKTHVVVGYDIVKNIEFPWPIATSILQHHERINGSGYPSKITDKEIIIEAKILAVADVLEAMATHRPYRPALPIEKAIEEISQNKGVLYDEDVVECCLKVFYEKGFDLEA